MNGDFIKVVNSCLSSGTRAQYILHNFLVPQYLTVPKGFPAFLLVDPLRERVIGVLRVLGQLSPPELSQPELLSFDEFCILIFFLMFYLLLSESAESAFIGSEDSETSAHYFIDFEGGKLCKDVSHVLKESNLIGCA